MFDAVQQQLVLEHLTHRNLMDDVVEKAVSTPVKQSSKTPTKLRRGIGKTFEPINRLQDMVSRAINMCSRRRQIEAEGHQRLFLVDMSRVWESLGKIGMGRRSSRQHGGSNIIEPSPSPAQPPEFIQDRRWPIQLSYLPPSRGRI